MKKHIFRLPIGDWSDDGHGECNYDAEPILQLNIVAADEFPMLPFYGYDEKKRHIGFVGYGTF